MDERCKQYHSALSRCAELLDNMKDGDPITEVPDFLAAYLASQSQAAQPSEKQVMAVKRAAECVESYGRDDLAVLLREVAAHLAGQSQATRAVPDLHNAIMNLPCNYKGDLNFEIAYKEGHRDARHAAAELVNEFEDAQEVTQQAAKAETAEHANNLNKLTRYMPISAYGGPVMSEDSHGDWLSFEDVQAHLVCRASPEELSEQKLEHGSLADNLRIEQTDPGRWVVCVENWFPDEDSARAACRKWKAAYSAAPPVKVMVDRFLGWKLPEDFYPDAGISFDRAYADKWGMPSGTNLFHAGQAKAMFEYVLAPTTSTVSAHEGDAS